jgi:hypothetical protein
LAQFTSFEAKEQSFAHKAQPIAQKNKYHLGKTFVNTIFCPPFFSFPDFSTKIVCLSFYATGATAYQDRDVAKRWGGFAAPAPIQQKWEK